MRAGTFPAPAALALLATMACGDGAARDPGLLAWLRVEGGQFIAGALQGDPAGPALSSLYLNQEVVSPGDEGRPLSGTLPPDAASVAVGLDGDLGYWLLPAGPPDPQAPGQLGFALTFSLSPLLPAGSFQLFARTARADGRFGPALQAPLRTAPGLPPPAFALVLSWDTEADLDLHAVDPAGSEIYWGNINSYREPPGVAPGPDDWKQGGILDFDSNAGCVIDGRRREQITWASAVPSGRYLARVDTMSLCGQGFARWTVQALEAGVEVARATGEAIAADTRGGHGRGAGTLALELDLP